MITRTDVERVAGETGFRVEGVEKVLHLLGILTRLNEHEAAEGRWLLKGGTALNLLHLRVPRLSVDIDLNFTGEANVERLPDARRVFERALVACCEREGCTVHRTPGEHAGGKFRLRFSSVFGGPQNLEVDVNYVARVPLLDPERRTVTIDAFGMEVPFPTLALEELAAGKFAALMARTAARDRFDAVSLLELVPDLLRRPRFRIAFVCQAAGSRMDALLWPAELRVLEKSEVRTKLIGLLRVIPGDPPVNPETLAASLHEKLAAAVTELVQWTESERSFLERLTHAGEIEPQLLTDDPVLQSRIEQQPMLRWKRQHVRRHYRLDGKESE